MTWRRPEVSVHLFIVPRVVNRTIFFGSGAFALWRGPWRARVISATYCTGYLLINIFFPVGLDPAKRVPSATENLLSDLVLLAASLACVWRARRYWVVWAAAFALLEVATDAAFLALPTVTGYAFASANLIWSYALNAAVVWGALTEGGARRAPA